MDWVEVGFRVAEARMVKGWTRAELADRLDWDGPMLDSVESGTYRLPALELIRVARVLGRRAAWFVLPRLGGVPVFRGASTPHWVPSPLGALVEDVAAGVAALTTVTSWPGLGERPDPVPITSLEEAEEAAVGAREACGLSEDVGVVAAAAMLGLLVFVLPGDDPGADVAYLPLDGLGVALVDAGLAPHVRCRAAGQALGQHLAGGGYRVWRVGDDEVLDRFAGRFVASPNTVTTSWGEVAGYPVVDLEGIAIPRPYQQAVLNAYRAERINPDKAIDLLYGTLTPADLPALPPRAIDPVWLDANLGGPPPTEAEVQEAEWLNARRLAHQRAAVARDSLSSADAAARLGIAPDDLSQWVTEGRVLAFDYEGERMFPGWQFDAVGGLKPGLGQITEAFSGDVVMVSLWATKPNVEFDLRSPAAILKDSTVDAVILEARIIGCVWD